MGAQSSNTNVRLWSTVRLPTQVRHNNVFSFPVFLQPPFREARQNFSSLPLVAQEVEQIKSKIPGELLLNQNFTATALKNAINSSSFPIVHVATHGDFGPKAENTFILTWDGRIDANQLSELLRTGNPNSSSDIDLLVFSACRTATGDRQSPFGLAGIAARTGVHSTMASLWYLSDEATAQLMIQFYQELSNPTITKAEALRRAQLALLQDTRFRSPYYWAPFVLLGDWR